MKSIFNLFQEQTAPSEVFGAPIVLMKVFTIHAHRALSHYNTNIVLVVFSIIENIISFAQSSLGFENVKSISVPRPPSSAQDQDSS